MGLINPLIEFDIVLLNLIDIIEAFTAIEKVMLDLIIYFGSRSRSDLG